LKILISVLKTLVVYHLHGETGSSAVCANGKQKSLMAIGDLPLTQQPPIYRESLGRGRPTGEELQMVSTFSIWIFRLEFWTTFQDVPFIPEIFWSVEPKLPYHLHSDQKFRNLWPIW